MKKFIVALVGLCLLSFSVLAQEKRNTRPRVVTAPTPQEDSSSESKAKRPPVMIGDTKTSSPTATPTAPSGEVVEEDDEVIKVETNLVTFPVSVLDRDGRFITGLKKEDFQIFENGVEQQIDSFASVEQPFTVILMIDVSPSTAFQIDEIHEAAIAFVDQLRRDDKVIVVSFDEKFRVLSPATNNRSVLQNAIRKA
ncbi:MAG: VWA domain-containing protein, partial [Acidobacteriota bacterium]|nr:VWA domain-containing protein [Acidobacteriota bacterium]